MWLELSVPAVQRVKWFWQPLLCTSPLRLKLKKCAKGHIKCFFFFNFLRNLLSTTPSQQNNLTGVFSTASKTCQLILTWSQQFISVIMSCSHCKTGFTSGAEPTPARAHLGVVSAPGPPVQGAPETMGSGAQARRRGRGRRGAGPQEPWSKRSGAGGSSRVFGLAAGGGGGLCRVCREVRKSLSPGPGVSLRSAPAPAFCRGLFSAVSPSGSEQRPSSKPQEEGRGDGLR